MFNKKGVSLTDIPNFAIALVVIAMVLGIGAQVLNTMKSTSTMTSTATAFYGNSTFVADNATAVDFTPSTLLTDDQGETHFVSASCTGVALSNSSNTEDVTGNFTISGCTALLSANDVTINATNIKANFTYTFNVYNLNYNITRTGENSTSDFSDWQGTFAVILAASVVLGLVAMYLLNRNTL